MSSERAARSREHVGTGKKNICLFVDKKKTHGFALGTGTVSKTVEQDFWRKSKGYFLASRARGVGRWRHGGDGGEAMRPMSWSVPAPCHGESAGEKGEEEGRTAVLYRRAHCIHCTVLYCTVGHTVLCCTVLYSTVGHTVL